MKSPTRVQRDQTNPYGKLKKRGKEWEISEVSAEKWNRAIGLIERRETDIKVLIFDLINFNIDF